MKMLKAFMVAALVVAVSAGAASAQGLQYEWTGTGGPTPPAAPGGNWIPPTGTSNWDIATVPQTDAYPGSGATLDDDAIFDLSAASAYTVTLTANVDDGSGGTGMGNLFVHDDKVILNLNGKTLAQAGDNINSRTMWVGRDTGDAGYLTVDGNGDTNSTFKSGAGIYAGKDGYGEITFKNGVQVDIGYKIYIGGPSSPGGNQFTFDGSTTVAVAPMLYQGKGDLNVTGGASLNFHSVSGAHWGIMGACDGDGIGPNTMNVDGEGSILTTTTDGGLMMAWAGVTSVLNVTNGGEYNTPGKGPNIMNSNYAAATVGTATINVTGADATGKGSYCRMGTLEVGGHDDTVYPDGKNWIVNHTNGIGTVNVGKGAELCIDASNAAYVTDLVVYNSNSTIDVGGRINIVDGKLLMNGTAAQSAGPGNLNIDFDDAGAHGTIRVYTGDAGAGIEADVAGVGITYSAGGSFVPAVTGYYDFLVAENIDNAGTTDNMIATMGAFPSYLYSKVIVQSGDYDAATYDGFEALRLEFLQGDASLNGTTDGADFNLWFGGFNKPGTWGTGDFDLSGAVDGADFTLWFSSFNKNLGDGAPLPAPEPVTLVLLGIGGLALLRRRR